MQPTVAFFWGGPMDGDVRQLTAPLYEIEFPFYNSNLAASLEGAQEPQDSVVSFPVVKYRLQSRTLTPTGSVRAYYVFKGYSK